MKSVHYMIRFGEGTYGVFSKVPFLIDITLISSFCGIYLTYLALMGICFLHAIWAPDTTESLRMAGGLVYGIAIIALVFGSYVPIKCLIDEVIDPLRTHQRFKKAVALLNKHRLSRQQLADLANFAKQARYLEILCAYGLTEQKATKILESWAIIKHEQMLFG